MKYKKYIVLGLILLFSYIGSVGYSQHLTTPLNNDLIFTNPNIPNNPKPASASNQEIKKSLFFLQIKITIKIQITFSYH